MKRKYSNDDSGLHSVSILQAVRFCAHLVTVLEDAGAKLHQL